MINDNLYDYQLRFYSSNQTSPGLESLLESGNLKIIAASVSIPVLSGGGFVVKLDNPVDSGVDVYIQEVLISTSVAQNFNFVEDAVLTSPTTAADPARALNRGASDTTALTITYDSEAITSGMDFPGKYRVNGVYKLEGPSAVFKLNPGDNLALVGDSGNEQETSASFICVEISI